MGKHLFMSPTPEEMLVEAVNAYDYPSVTYDFVKEHEHRFESVRGLEHYLHDLLRAQMDRASGTGCLECSTGATTGPATETTA